MGIWMRIWGYTLWRPEIVPGCGGTPSTDRKSTRDVVEQTLPTGNRPGTWRNTLCRPENPKLREKRERSDRFASYHKKLSDSTLNFHVKMASQGKKLPFFWGRQTLGIKIF